MESSIDNILSATTLNEAVMLSCAWCLKKAGKPMGEGSHGICEPCANGFMEQYLMDQKRLYKFKEAMQYLSLSRSGIYRRIASGRRKGLKVGGTWRFMRAQLDASNG